MLLVVGRNKEAPRSLNTAGRRERVRCENPSAPTLPTEATPSNRPAVAPHWETVPRLHSWPPRNRVSDGPRGPASLSAKAASRERRGTGERPIRCEVWGRCCGWAMVAPRSR
jgi:hypothetical protein